MSIHSVMTLFSSGDMIDGEEKGIGGDWALLDTGSQGRDVLRPNSRHISGLVLALPG